MTPVVVGGGVLSLYCSIYTGTDSSIQLNATFVNKILIIKCITLMNTKVVSDETETTIMVLMVNEVATVKASYSHRNTATECEYIWKQNGLETSRVYTCNYIRHTS
jgi:hypothetical protein